MTYSQADHCPRKTTVGPGIPENLTSANPGDGRAAIQIHSPWPRPEIVGGKMAFFK